MLVKAISALLVYVSAAAVLEVGDAARQHDDAGHRLVMRSALSGKAGEVITCYDVADPRPDSTVLFPHVDADVARVTATWTVADADGRPHEQVQRYTANQFGSLPMLGGVRRLTIEFLKSGSVEVEVYERRQGGPRP